MSSRTLQVFIGDRLAGTLRFEAQGARQRTVFQFGAEWLARPDRFTFDPALQLVTGPQFRRPTGENSVFPSAIADTEPDGWGRRVILRDHAKRRQADRRRGRRTVAATLDAVDYLLAVDDGSRVGALRFQDEAGIFQRAPEAGRRATPPLLELGHLLAATRAVENDSETAADLAYLRGRGTSLGGLRPKCSVIDDDGRLSIGKFPSVTDQTAVTKAEVLAMRLARRAGITAADARLVNSDGIPVALVRRFDRTADGARLPYISAATMLGADPAEEHSYTEMVDALRVHGAAVQHDCEELWRRIAFSILITNIDDHLRNHGFLHVARGQWRLAPAFDLNPFPDRARELKTWISEEAGPEATIEGLLTVAPYFRIGRPRAAEIIGQVENAVATWRSVGDGIGMSVSELAQYAEAFEHPEREAARQAASLPLSTKTARRVGSRARK
jgi:serine/threonine-protein kinase HipA